MGDILITTLADAYYFSVDNSKVTVVIHDGEGYEDYYWYEVQDVASTEIKVSSIVTYFNVYGKPFYRNSKYEKSINMIETITKPNEAIMETKNLFSITDVICILKNSMVQASALMEAAESEGDEVSEEYYSGLLIAYEEAIRLVEKIGKPKDVS